MKSKAITREQLLKLGACLSLILLLGVAGLAQNTANLRISVEVKEWLVLQIGAPGFNDLKSGQEQAVVITDVIAGQPVEVKALLSVAAGKTVLLKGTIFGSGQNSSGNDILAWSGEGELNGQGLVRLNQEFTFATWSGPGFKEGRLVFKRPEPTSSAPERWQAVFLLVSL
jgi:hypothetical protein